MALILTSSAFRDGEAIPRACTCDGDDLTPPLTWTGAPEGTGGFALVMDDPDAPHGTFTHWVVYDIPGSATGLRKEAGKTLRNDFGRTGYGGPCPPRGHGPHRYVLTLRAVDVPALDVQGTTRESLERALDGHVIATARLTGIYERKLRK
jgi:Raf kinase inhibitor-like YbhB/YbcL family protein